MLGIESEISIQGEVSRLSLSSNASRLTKQKIFSQNNPSILKSQDAVSTNPSTNPKNEKIKFLRNRMQEISRNQESMDTRMKAYILMIQKQLKKKEEQNRQLENLVKQMKEELSQSRGDIEILTNYVNKKIASAPRQEPKSLRSSNLNLMKNQNLVPVSKQMEIKNEKPTKSISPKSRGVVIDKAKNQSPMMRQQKKITASGMVSSPFHRKLKSPFK